MAELGAGLGSSYPGSLDTDATLEVNSPSGSKTKARAAVPNDLAAAIIALQTELGTDPAGSLTNVKTFLQTEHNTDGTHKNSLVMMLAGSQTATGLKSFSAGVTISGLQSGALTVSGIAGFSPAIAKASLHSSTAYKDEANVFTADQTIQKDDAILKLKKATTAVQTPRLAFYDSAAALIGYVGIESSSDEWRFADNTTTRVSFARTTGKMTAGTVPLARLSAADANSGYPQSGTGGETLRTLRGKIQGSDGSILMGTGFSCVRNSTGNYTITFTTAFSAAAVTVATMAVGVGFIYALGTDGSSVTILTTNTSSVASDTNFFFVTVGPS